jgi:hypothetical protein
MVMLERLLSQSKARSPELISAGALALAAFAGWAIGRGQLLFALAPVAIILGVLLVSTLSLRGWCVVLLLSTVGVRFVTASLHLPTLVNFLHYPAVLAFVYAASNRPRPSEKLPASRWLIGLLFVTAISSIANLTNPFRLIFFLTIAIEPLLVVWGIQRWGPDQATEQRVIGVFFWLLAIQIPIGLWQGSRGGWADSVQGTLLGQGAGAHILSGLFALGLFVWLAGILDGRRPIWTVVFAVIIAFGMMGAASALQVIFLSAASLPAVIFASRQRRPLPGEDSKKSGLSLRREAARRISKRILAVLILVVGGSAPFWAQAVVPGALDRARNLLTLQNFQEIQLPLARARSAPEQVLVGSGPATSSSRAALLLTPRYSSNAGVNQGSIFLHLGLKPTALALKISEESSNLQYGGSVESAASSMLAVVGDLGIIGVVGLMLLLIGIFRASKRAGSWLAPALAAALIMSAGLSFIDNWLEFPEYTITFAILIGFATLKQVSWAQYRPLPAHRVRSLADPDRA